MAFGRNGRGISKEEAAKRNYFDMFGRHFTHIVEVSLLYFLCNILFFGASAFLFVVYFGNGNLDNAIVALLNGKVYVLPVVPFIPLMLTGPFTAGFTYVIRNYAKQEHAFIVSDFFEHTKKNLKQGLAASIIGYLVMYLMLQALFVYNSFAVSAGIPREIVFGIFAMISVLLIIMSFYVYPIMVTLKLKLKHIFKNAWIFTLIKLPQNFLIFALLFAIHAVVFYGMVYTSNLFVFYVALMMFFLTGFTSFTANYYIWHVLDKYIVSKVTPQNTTNTEDISEDNDGEI